jgi:hypothetical protein
LIFGVRWATAHTGPFLFVRRLALNGDGGKKRGRPKSYMDAYDGRLIVRMSKDDIDILDQISKKKNKTKSELVRNAIIRLINDETSDFLYDVK